MNSAVSILDMWREIGAYTFIKRRSVLYFKDPESSEVEGTTGFLRYPDFQRQLIKYLKRANLQRPATILALADSVGTDSKSYAMLAEEEGVDVVIDTLDISKKFSNISSTSQYLEEMIEHLGDLKKFFRKSATPGFVEPVAAVTNKINVLPADDVLNYKPQKPYDVVIALSILLHIPWYNEEERDYETIRRFSEKIISLSRDLVCVNRMDDTPYEITRQRAIHNPFLGKNISMLDADFYPVSRSFHKYEDISFLTAERDGIDIFQKTPGF